MHYKSYRRKNSCCTGALPDPMHYTHGRKSEADNGGDIMFFSNRRQPIVAQLPKKLMSGGRGGGGLRHFFPQRHLRWQFFSDRLGGDAASP